MFQAGGLTVLRQSSFVSSGPRGVVSTSQRIFSHLAQDPAARRQRTPLKIPLEKVFATMPLPSRSSGNYYYKNAEEDDTSSLYRHVVRTSDFKPMRRYFSALTSLHSSDPPHFSEDYDEWYSHGTVGIRTRPSWEGDYPAVNSSYSYDHHDTGSGRMPGCFLLEELKREELQLQLHQNEQHDMDDLFFEFELPEEKVAGNDALDFYEILEDETCNNDE